MPSGAVLVVNDAPFDDAKCLYQAMMKELRAVEMRSDMSYNALLKDIFCLGLSSPVIESSLAKCMARCTYDYGKGAMKIDKDSFEPRERREDYIPACMEVARENVGPFMKSLSAAFSEALGVLTGILTSKEAKTAS